MNEQVFVDGVLCGQKMGRAIHWFENATPDMIRRYWAAQNLQPTKDIPSDKPAH